MVIDMKIKDILSGNISKKNIDICKKIIKGVVVFLLFHYGVIYFQLLPVKILHIDISSHNDTLRVILSSFSNFILMFIFYIIYRKDLAKEWKQFKSNFWENINIGFSAWFIGLLFMFAFNIILTVVLKSEMAQNEQLVQSMINTLPLLMVIEAAFVVPFVEEIVFRKTLKDVFKNVYVFMIMSFLLFGGAHVFNSPVKSITDVLFIIPYGSLGAAFAYAYHKTDTVFTTISIHCFHNFVMSIMSIILLFI